MNHHFFQHFIISSHATTLFFLTNYRGWGFLRSLNNLTICIPLSGGALPFAVDQKEEKVLSKLSFLPPPGFFFPSHFPEYPPKTALSFAGPDYFDRPSLLFTFR
jgi:hypothetical protein